MSRRITVHSARNGNADGRTFITCGHCGVMLIVPDRCQSERFESLLIGFEVDHAACGKDPTDAK